ncbi:uncharacterized protein BJ171DRAFT_472683 [Polychytrium aggregatum]|uniref:uncharacterized protein n=1 Tax=Polychytrium aggregatum TaxID=110093 RepID=UPI0022FF42F9|nr:uncharacterized protein BJ171DRAFT_472683 [Polychytrium aggregatum]KAI9207274.1 hypothetical protein BJ171DRAFT_472683 [Polychytrium aggregatum]
MLAGAAVLPCVCATLCVWRLCWDTRGCTACCPYHLRRLRALALWPTCQASARDCAACASVNRQAAATRSTAQHKVHRDSGKPQRHRHCVDTAQTRSGCGARCLCATPQARGVSAPVWTLLIAARISVAAPLGRRPPCRLAAPPRGHHPCSALVSPALSPLQAPVLPLWHKACAGASLHPRCPVRLVLVWQDPCLPLRT